MSSAARCGHPSIAAVKSAQHGKTTLTCEACGLTKDRQSTDSEADAWWPDVALARAAFREAKAAAIAEQAPKEGGSNGA